MHNYYLINVYLPLNLVSSYTYKVPSNVGVNVGDMVLVPLKNKLIYAIVISVNVSCTLPENKIRAINKKIDSQVSLNSQLIQFLQWVSKYTLYNFGNVLKMAINVSGFNFSIQEEFLQINNSYAVNNINITAKRKQIIDFVKQNQPILKSQVLAHFNGSSVVATLIKQNVLQKVLHTPRYTLQNNIKYSQVALNQAQQQVATAINHTISQQQFCVNVLYGVPGSGKTEVYFSAINAALQQNKQVLVLLPEIALSAQLVDHFTSRFGVQPFVWHSEITATNKQKTFLAANNGDLKVIIGARSALFLPFKNLGLIIVDEEHDSSYKQEEGVIYNAKDMAIVRAKITQIPIVLASATPSLETLHNAKINKFNLFTIDSRFNQIELPDIEVIDMQQQPKNTVLSNQLLQQISQTISNNQQVLLFVNKRGYSGTVFCSSCKESLLCKNCSVNMVYHKGKNLLICHYCGYNHKLQGLTCSSCLTPNALNFVGVGVEKVQEELLQHFKDNTNINSIILSSDTLDSNAKRKQHFANVLNNKYNILIGTQIIAKGYNFPNLTLVAIVDADFVNPTDLKATEKAWQLLYQVAGRSGRFSQKGKVMLQTYKKNDFLIESLVKKDYNEFIDNVIKAKQQALIPPFGKWIAIIISAKNKVLVQEFCNYLLSSIPNNQNIQALGPIEAPLFMLRGYYRYRFLIKADLKENVQKFVKQWLNSVNVPSQIKLQIDVDPLSFY